MSRLTNTQLNTWYPRILTGGALIGLIASFWQVVERINMLKYPESPLNCNLNPVINCGDVLGHKLAALFGFPNALLGIVMFTVLLVCGLAMLASAQVNKWFWKVFAGVAVMLILFSVWFFATSLYVIGSVCIFCIFIWTVSVPIFLYAIDWLITNKHLTAKWTKSRAMDFVRLYNTEILISVYTLMLIMYFFRFRDFYF